MVRRLWVAAAVTFVLVGCGMPGGIKSVIHKEEQETDYSTVCAEIVEFSGIRNKEYQSELNMSVENDVCEAIEEFDAISAEASEGLPPGIKSTLYITQHVKRTKDGILSFLSEHYIYTGGAHGVTSWYPRTIDTLAENPHDLTLGELFADNEYMEKLNKIIEKKVEDNPDRYSELWAKPTITQENQNRFYLTDSDLVIYFPPYELSYYAKGFIEFPIPIEELTPILNDRFKQENVR